MSRIRSVGRLITLALCLLAWASAPPGALAQETLPDAPSQRLGPVSFATLAGERAAVRYTPGALDRATHVLRRLEVLAYHFGKWSDMSTPLAVYVLGRPEWREAEVRFPYGLPLSPGPTAILAPALGDDGTVAMWQKRIGTLPRVQGRPLIGTAEHVATLAIADILLQVEASRSFARRGGLVGTEPWIAEVAAHVAAQTVFLEHERERVAEIDQLFHRFGALLDEEGNDSGGLPLAGYSPLLPLAGDRGLDRWLWYQSRFHRGALIVLERHGRGAIKKLLRMSERTGGGLRQDQLLARYPALAAWLAEFPAAASRP